MTSDSSKSPAALEAAELVEAIDIRSNAMLIVDLDPLGVLPLEVVGDDNEAADSEEEVGEAAAAPAEDDVVKRLEAEVEAPGDVGEVAANVAAIVAAAPDFGLRGLGGGFSFVGFVETAGGATDGEEAMTAAFSVDVVAGGVIVGAVTDFFG